MQSVMASTPTVPLRLGLTAAVLAIGLAAIFFDTWSSMVTVWSNSESFAHGFVIPLISLWLIWRGRASILAQPIAPCWLASIPLLGCALLWLIGRLAGVNSAQQFAVVLMIPALVTLCFGWRFALSMAFPLAFLLFAVPFGNFLLPLFMQWTADFTVIAVRLSGVPIIREGLLFELPSGRWSVVESCSGLRYLLAALPLACVFAYLNYRSIKRRLVFIGATIALSIVANWVRAYLIVMIGHVSNMTIAVGVDHLVYGWLFFGIVIGLAFWMGGKFADADEAPNPPSTHTARPPSAALATGTRVSASAIATALLLLLPWPIIAGQLLQASKPVVDLRAAQAVLKPLPVTPDLGPTGRRFHPAYQGGIATAAGISAEDPAVSVRIVQYANQSRHGEMIRDSNRTLPGGADNPDWQIVRRNLLTPSEQGSPFPGSTIAEELVGGPDGKHLVWTWFWVNGSILTSPARVKGQTALDLLTGRGDESIAWFVWTPFNDNPTAARARLAAQVRRLGTLPLRPPK